MCAFLLLNPMNRRTFAKQLVLGPAVLSSVSSAALAALSSTLTSSALAAGKSDPGLDQAARQLLRDEFFIDAAGCDRFYRYPSESPLAYDPDKILPLVGGAVLGLAHLTPDPTSGTHDPRVLGKPGDGRYAKHVRSLGIEQKTSAPVTAQNSKVRAHA